MGFLLVNHPLRPCINTLSTHVTEIFCFGVMVDFQMHFGAFLYSNCMGVYHHLFKFSQSLMTFRFCFWRFSCLQLHNAWNKILPFEILFYRGVTKNEIWFSCYLGKQHENLKILVPNPHNYQSIFGKGLKFESFKVIGYNENEILFFEVFTFYSLYSK